MITAARQRIRGRVFIYFVVINGRSHCTAVFGLTRSNCLS
jgi:hypothetical protein